MGLAGAAALAAELEHICVGRITRFTLLAFGGRGTPLAIDVRKVVGHAITPTVTTGALHRSDAASQIGADVAVAPLSCFRAALLDLDRRLSTSSSDRGKNAT